MVKLSEEIINTSKVHQTNSHVCVWKANELKLKLSQSLAYAYVSQTKVNDMEFDTLMKISFK